MALAPAFGKRFRLAAKRILYVTYNPATLVRDEQSLTRAGYEVETIFGTDGVMACRSVAKHAFVLIGDACPFDEKKKVVWWLAVHFPKLNILPAGWVQRCAGRR